ncbi:hypothetical protein LBMAG36_16090 [Chlorobiota bacterium]|nr:hypothetical protein LBMAG36_16090 [Chlorobiota bacterium]
MRIMSAQMVNANLMNVRANLKSTTIIIIAMISKGKAPKDTNQLYILDICSIYTFNPF